MASHSSIIHLLLSTVPLLLLLGYFMYLAIERPQVIAAYYYNVGNGEEEDFPVLISLNEMLDTCLVLLNLWSSLAFYLLFFVPKRRKLMKSYLGEQSTNSVMTVVGDVFYERPKSCGAKIGNCIQQVDIAYVTYQLPNTNEMVEKKVRTYHLYHREKVSVKIISGFPFSGQPSADVEKDVISYKSEYASRNHNKICQVLMVCVFWIIICVISVIIILHQIIQVSNDEDFGDEYKDNVDAAWLSFWIMTCLVLPIVAIGGNVIRWILYRNWILHGGASVPTATKVPPKSVQPEELHNDAEGGFSLFG